MSENHCQKVYDKFDLDQKKLSIESVINLRPAHASALFIDTLKDKASRSTLSEFKSSDECLRALGVFGIDPTQTESLDAILSMTWAVGRYVAGGRRCYRPSPGLCQRLSATRITGVKWQDVKMPFDDIYIELEPGTIRTRGYDTKEIVDVDGLYVCRDGDEGFIVVATMDIDIFKFGIYTKTETRDIEDCLGSLTVDGISDLDKRGVEDRESFNEFVRDSTRFIVNILFYVSMPGAESRVVDPRVDALRKKARKLPKTRNKKRKKIEQEIKRIKKRPVTILGEHVPVKRDFDGKLTRVKVAGHWQRYHVGPRSNSRVVWRHRAPHWRGDIVDSSTKSTIYELE